MAFRITIAERAHPRHSPLLPPPSALSDILRGDPLQVSLRRRIPLCPPRMRLQAGLLQYTSKIAAATRHGLDQEVYLDSSLRVGQQLQRTRHSFATRLKSDTASGRGAFEDDEHRGNTVDWARSLPVVDTSPVLLASVAPGASSMTLAFTSSTASSPWSCASCKRTL